MKMIKFGGNGIMLIRRMQYMDMMNFSLKQANFLMKEQMQKSMSKKDQLLNKHHIMIMETTNNGSGCQNQRKRR